MLIDLRNIFFDHFSESALHFVDQGITKDDMNIRRYKDLLEKKGVDAAEKSELHTADRVYHVYVKKHLSNQFTPNAQVVISKLIKYYLKDS
jgi:hypothetical protein